MGTRGRGAATLPEGFHRSAEDVALVVEINVLTNYLSQDARCLLALMCSVYIIEVVHR